MTAWNGEWLNSSFALEAQHIIHVSILSLQEGSKSMKDLKRGLLV